MKSVLFFAFFLGCIGQRIVMLPLDERFTTRDAFLNLAKVTPYQVITPDVSMLPHQKKSANTTAILDWLDEHVQSKDTLILSAEMFLYGGLIASRVTNDSTEAVWKNAQRLIHLKNKHHDLTIYLSTVIMRIPAYNEDVEEPWYWALYGINLYHYSYYLDEYYVTGDETYLKQAKEAIVDVPNHIVTEFLWRRERNHNITVMLMERQAQSESIGMPIFKRIFCTLDDNAKFGLNIRESNEIRQLVQQLNISSRINIYPGADEVGMTMLARFASDRAKTSPTFRLIFRDPKTIYYIPNYEGQPLIDTIHDQISAAGGIPTNDSNPDIFFLVNNFSTKQQIEAPNQPTNGSIEEYAVFDKFINGKNIVGFADVKFSNGADIFFVDYIFDRFKQNPNLLPINNFAYAGWNTDGNTLGTVISNNVLLHFYRNRAEANAYFNSLRFLEDNNYQVTLRQDLQNYIWAINGASINDLDSDIDFYTRYVWKRLNSNYQDIVKTFNLNFNLKCVYFPWDRTFEIGFDETDLANCKQ